MQQKKRKLFVLYSIPIWFRKKLSRLNLCSKEKLYLVSYSIPLSCMVVLLLGLGLMINQGLFSIDKSSAVTIQDEWVVEKSGSASDSEDSVDSDVHGRSAEDSDATMFLSESDAESSLLASNDVAGITFSIGGAAKDATIEATPGAVAYREHTVTVDISNADEYVMLISGSDNNDIALDTNESAKLVGITNATSGSNIPAGQWGYGWDYTGNISKENMTYQAVPSVKTEILTPKLNSSTNSVSFTGKLAFAGKFPEGAAAGSYTGGTATLMLVVSPKSTTSGALWKKADGSNSGYYSGVYAMQEIDTVVRDGGFCKDNTVVQPGWTIELQDNRGPNPVIPYKIVKLSDGKCWMQQNLRLGSTSEMLLEPSNTNIKSDYTLPAGTNSGSWDANDYNAQQVRLGNTSWNNSWQTSWGNYYSWCAATASTCNESTADNVNVSGSICPKGWHLPSGGSASNADADTGQNSEFYKLFGTNGINLGSNYQIRFDAIIASPYLFSAAGRITGSGGSLVGPGSYGYYWSRTSKDGANAYHLYFNGSNFHPGTYSNEAYRYRGYSVRCVADY